MLSPTTGKTVPLSLFVKVDPNGTSSLTVNHQGEFPAVTLSFNLAPGVALSQATKAVEDARRRWARRRPSPAHSRAPPRLSSNPCRTSRS